MRVKERTRKKVREKEREREGEREKKTYERSVSFEIKKEQIRMELLPRMPYNKCAILYRAA